MSEGKEAVTVPTSQALGSYTHTIEIAPQQTQMQAADPSQQSIVSQGAQQVQAQGLSQAGMAQVMTQGPQTAPSPHAVTASLPPQSPQYYVQASVASCIQGPPAIAPAPGPQATTTTVSAIHQPLQHHLAPQPLTHPGVSPSPMQQFPPQVQVIQSSIPGGPYLQQLYQNAQGQIIMPIQQATGMNTQLQPGTLNPLNSSIQVITGKPFQSQLTPHMLATGGKGVLQPGQGGKYLCDLSGYSHAGNPASGGQTVLIGQLGAQLTGVISSQPQNILPAQTNAPKPGEMHKVNNMSSTYHQAATFGSVQQGIAWASPGTLQSPTLFTHNSPIVIRGAQPGQENVLFQSAQAQAMVQPNSMVPPIATLTAAPQQAKPRSGIEAQANIQPKVPSMRPPILPSVTSGQLRPGSSVSTQTAAGQAIAPAHLGTQRSQGKVRGKNAANRSSPAMGAQQQQMSHIGIGHVLQPQQAAALSVSGVATSASLSAVLPVTTQPISIAAAAVPKQVSQGTTAEAYHAAHSKPGTPVHPPTAPIHTTPPGVRLAKGAQSPSPMSTACQMTAPATVLTTVAAPMHLPPQATPTTPVSIVPTTRSAALPVAAPMIIASTSSYCPTTGITTTTTTTSTGLNESASLPSGKQTGIVVSQQMSGVAATQTSQLNAIPNGRHEDGVHQSPKKEPPFSPVASSGSSAGPTVTSSTSTASFNHTTVNAGGTENGGISTAALPNGTASAAEKNSVNSAGPPKAMVKPQVMTHVIEGFVIHEASEPFPVSRSSLLSDLNKVRNSSAYNTATVLPHGNEKEEEKESSRCEACGKPDQRLKFKKSKRFCSSCAKSSGMSKRVGPFKSPDEPGAKRYKEENDSESANFAPADGDTLANVSGAICHQDSSQAPEDHSIKTSKSDILKWTVKDVVEFIQNLPGCQDYAEDFELQEIDGQALMLLKADHLMSAMSIKLGPALKICNQIENMRGDKKET